jgi:hypothetical protein
MNNPTTPPPEAGAIPEPTDRDLAKDLRHLYLGWRENATSQDLRCAAGIIRRLAAAERDRDDARRRVSKWQPIETAPKHTALVVTDGERAAVSSLELDYGEDYYWAIESDDFLEWHPTHWMPLPAAPGTGGTTGGNQ